MNPVVVVGDALLDRDVDGRAERLCPDAPAPVVSDLRTRSRPGGAALAATLAASDGRHVTLVTAVADDAVGHELLNLLAERGVETINLGCTAPTAEKVRVRVAGHTLVRMDRGAPSCGKVGTLIHSAQRALALAGVVLVSDYGRGLMAQPDMRVALAPQVGRQVVWDPHPRGAQPVGGARIVTPNEAEAAMAGDDGLGGLASLTAQARRLARSWEAGGVAITLGARGALLVQGDNPPMMAPAIPRSGDACGAGDRFAATLAAMLADGALPSEACIEAVAAASDYVAGGSAGALPDGRSTGPMADASTAVDTVRSVRAAGGTVVATGGCFDLLHRGHVRMLESARRLGDCLVVLLNSDASVRRLKGPARPMVAGADRAAVLGALECVDGVIEFEEDTPCAALEQLRPDVFAKGGDYGLDELPEQATMAQWGGQCVVLPYLQGRSTSALLKEVQRRGLA